MPLVIVTFLRQCRGQVEQVSFSKKGHAFLNFGGKYPQHSPELARDARLARLALMASRHKLISFGLPASAILVDASFFEGLLDPLASC
jgi:hypothetical protein